MGTEKMYDIDIVFVDEEAEWMIVILWMMKEMKDRLCKVHNSFCLDKKMRRRL